MEQKYPQTRNCTLPTHLKNPHGEPVGILQMQQILNSCGPAVNLKACSEESAAMHVQARAKADGGYATKPDQKALFPLQKVNKQQRQPGQNSLPMLAPATGSSARRPNRDFRLLV